MLMIHREQAASQQLTDLLSIHKTSARIHEHKAPALPGAELRSCTPSNRAATSCVSRRYCQPVDASSIRIFRISCCSSVGLIALPPPPGAVGGSTFPSQRRSGKRLCREATQIGHDRRRKEGAPGGGLPIHRRAFAER